MTFMKYYCLLFALVDITWFALSKAPTSVFMFIGATINILGYLYYARMEYITKQYEATLEAAFRRAADKIAEETSKDA